MPKLRKWKNREYNHIFGIHVSDQRFRYISIKSLLQINEKGLCNKKMGKWTKNAFQKGIKIKPKYTKRY